MLGKMLIYNLISYNIVCNTNTTTNANEIKALTRVESEIFQGLAAWKRNATSKTEIVELGS